MPDSNDHTPSSTSGSPHSDEPTAPPASTVEDETERLVPDQIAAGPAQSGDIVAAEGSGNAAESEAVTSPAKVMRIGSMVRQLLEEVRQAPLDEASRERLAEVYERSVTELSDALSEDLQEELRSLALPFSSDAPSESELRVAKAQLVGWLEGLFHGIQATLFAQQLAARQQFEQMRQLPPGAGQPVVGQPGGGDVGGGADSAGSPGGVYL